MGATIPQLGAGHADLHEIRRSASVSVHLRLIAARSRTLCGIWANRKSFLLAPRWRTDMVENTSFGSKRPLNAKVRQSTSDSRCP